MAAPSGPGPPIAIARTTVLPAITSAWEHVRASPWLKGGFLYAVTASFVLLASTLPTPEESPVADAERAAFDAQMRLLRALHPRPVADDIVLIGIDEDTEAEFTEPLALWHRHFAVVLHALAAAK